MKLSSFFAGSGFCPKRRRKKTRSISPLWLPPNRTSNNNYPRNSLSLCVFLVRDQRVFIFSLSLSPVKELFSNPFFDHAKVNAWNRTREREKRDSNHKEKFVRCQSLTIANAASFVTSWNVCVAKVEKSAFSFILQFKSLLLSLLTKSVEVVYSASPLLDPEKSRKTHTHIES